MDANQTDSGMFVSLPAAARSLGVSVKRLKLAIDMTQIPARRIGQRLMIPRRALERLAESEQE
jgi:hypothetical protein